MKLLGLENGLPDDLTPYAEPFRRTGEGVLTVYLRKGKDAPALLHVWTDSGLSADITL